MRGGYQGESRMLLWENGRKVKKKGKIQKEVYVLGV
jgi:hypothetical protein